MDVVINGVARNVTSLNDLPKEAFKIHGVTFAAGNRINDFSYLSVLPELDCIVCKNSELDAKALRSLAGLRSLVHIDFQRIRLPPDGLTLLPPQASWLALDVTLGGKPIEDEDLRFLASFPSAVVLSLFGSNVTDEGIKKVVNYCPKLGWIDITGSRVTDKGVELLRVLPLWGFYVWYGTGITDKSVEYLSECRNLGLLCLGSPQITDANLPRLSALTKLHTLHLVSSSVGDEGIKVLPRLPELTYLAAPRGITDNGLETISRLKLRRLEMFECEKITDRGLSRLETMTTLESLMLPPRGSYTTAGIVKLQAALPNCRITANPEIQKALDAMPKPAAPQSGRTGSTTSPLIGPDGKWQLPADAPPPAIAPFDAVQARKHQEAWAKYLCVSVETTNSIGMKLVLIPPGEFEMGSTEGQIAQATDAGKKNRQLQWYFDDLLTERPRHTVKITKPFYFGVYQVTQGEYEAVMGTNPSGFCVKQVDVSTFHPPLDPKVAELRHANAKQLQGKEVNRHPVETVSWGEATEFCRRLSAISEEKTARRVYRLPTEARWEYSCRAGTTTRWYCGDDEASLSECAWCGVGDFVGTPTGTTHPVGQKKPNPWGLHDMHGNVLQWCSDWKGDDYYQKSLSSDPEGPAEGLYRIARGGCWIHGPYSSSSAYRGKLPPVCRMPDLGFRVAIDITDIRR